MTLSTLLLLISVKTASFSGDTLL